MLMPFSASAPGWSARDGARPSPRPRTLAAHGSSSAARYCLVSRNLRMAGNSRLLTMLASTICLREPLTTTGGICCRSPMIRSRPVHPFSRRKAISASSTALSRHGPSSTMSSAHASSSWRRWTVILPPSRVSLMKRLPSVSCSTGILASACKLQPSSKSVAAKLVAADTSATCFSARIAASTCLARCDLPVPASPWQKPTSSASAGWKEASLASPLRHLG